MAIHDNVMDGPVIERTPVNGTCEHCGAAALKTYPVLGEGGWFTTVKCQACLHSAERSGWRLLGPVSLTSEGIVIA